MKTLLVEGWRRVSHSYALVNQAQLLALAARGDIRLLHRELPYPSALWRPSRSGDIFTPEEGALLDLLPAPDAGTPIDAVFRIASPFRAGLPDGCTSTARLAIFIAVELCLTSRQFRSEQDLDALRAADHPIVTPSRWSRDRIVEGGIDPARIHVVAHGADQARFHPVDPETRAEARRALGLAADETAFLSIGIPSWHKGTDLLLKAFAALRLRGHNVRLLMKDLRDVYGRTAEQAMDALNTEEGPVCVPRVREGIVALPRTLDAAHLNALYGAADCYVSPYRGEGFNMPALEAIACGLPVITTAGGATDDFCDDRVAIRLPARLSRTRDAVGTDITYLEPELDALVHAMGVVATGGRPDIAAYDAGRRDVLARCSWEAAASRIAAITLGTP